MPFKGKNKNKCKKNQFFSEHGHFWCRYVKYCQILLKMSDSPRELLAGCFSSLLCKAHSSLQYQPKSSFSSWENKNNRMFHSNWGRQNDSVISCSLIRETIFHCVVICLARNNEYVYSYFTWTSFIQQIFIEFQTRCSRNIVLANILLNQTLRL